jgi:hypothetical protein
MKLEDLKIGKKFIYKNGHAISHGFVSNISDVIELQWVSWEGSPFTKKTKWTIESALKYLDFKTPEYEQNFEEMLGFS